jgi:hypothetical protein
MRMKRLHIPMHVSLASIVNIPPRSPSSPEWTWNVSWRITDAKEQENNYQAQPDDPSEWDILAIWAQEGLNQALSHDKGLITVTLRLKRKVFMC